MEELKSLIENAKGKTLLFLLKLVKMIMEVFQSGNFTDSENQLKEEEKAIREMSRTEKAIFSLSNTLILIKKSLMEEQEKLLQGENVELVAYDCSCPICALGSVLFGHSITIGKNVYSPKDVSHPDWLRVLALDKEIDDLDNQIEALNEFFWDSVQTDLPEEEIKDFDALDIRQGFQIVACKKQEETKE